MEIRNKAIDMYKELIRITASSMYLTSFINLNKMKNL